MTDQEELTAGADGLITDRTSADSDGDGLGDGQELVAGTSALNPYSDADGMPDGWEYRFNLNPLAPSDAGSDGDGDGYSNWAEWLAGTSPADAGSFFRFATIQRAGDGGIVSWSAISGRVYTISALDDLRTTTWTQLQPALTAVVDTTVSYSNRFDRATRSFRVNVQLP